MELPPDPVRLSWDNGQRALWLCEIATPNRARDEDTIIERMLEDVEAHRPLREADLTHLSDEGLLDVFEDIERELNPRSLRYVLARLGTRIAPAIIQSVTTRLPSTAAVSTLEPVDSPLVAPLMVRALGRNETDLGEVGSERWQPTLAERWLEQHATSAARGLWPAYADAGSVDHQPHANALAFIASVGGVDALRAAADHYGSSSSALLDRLLDFAPLQALRENPPGDWVAPLLAVGPLETAIHCALVASDALAERKRLARPFARWLCEGTHQVREKSRVFFQHADTRRALTSLAERGNEIAIEALGLLNSTTGPAERAAVHRFPDPMPEMPDFWYPKDFRVRLRSGEVLGADAMTHLGSMLRFSALNPTYVGLKQVKEVCDPQSLDELCVELLRRWCKAGEPGTELWAMYATGHVGGRRAAEEVGGKIDTWMKSGEKGRSLLMAAIGVLAANRSDPALVNLDDLARRGPNAAIRRLALEALSDARQGRAIVREQPMLEAMADFGLDADGSRTFDLGDRVVVTRFDEELVPRVFTSEGVKLRGFPRSRKGDDTQKFEVARRAYRELQTAARAALRRQLAKLEEAMVVGHRLTQDLYYSHVLEHPLMRRAAQRLIWGAYQDGELTSFRVRADLSFVDIENQRFELPAGASIGIPHPLELPAYCTRWSERLDEFGLSQPFEQLQRETFRRRGEKSAELRLERSLPIAGGRLLDLRGRGWSAKPFHILGAYSPERVPFNGEREKVRVFERSLPDGHLTWIEVDPGVDMRNPKTPAAQTLGRVRAGAPLSKLSAISYSELRRDLEYLVGSS